MVPINQDDLQKLNVDYHNNESNIWCIQGSSKSGKTTFIRDFIVKKEYLYLGGYPSNGKVLFANCITQLNKKYKLKHSSRFYDTFESILSLINEIIFKEKTAIIFDDFHEFLKVDKNALSDLLKYWNKYLSNKPLLLLFILNNSQQKDFLIKNNIKQIHMNEFSFTFLRNKPVLTPTDKFYLYSIFGNSNQFYTFYNTKLELTKNVYNLAFQPASPFYNYGFEYLKKDFSDIGTFCSILYAISIGNNKIGDIADFIGLKSTYLTRYIQKLLDFMIIEKQLPLTNTKSNSKFGRYFIKDHFLRFWFCYIYPNRMLLDIKRHTSILNDLDKTIQENVLIPSYKKYITNLIQSDPIKYLGFEPTKFGPWWDNNNNTIDLVAFDEEQIVFINILWDSKENAVLQYPHLKEMSTCFSSSLKRNYIMISKNTYLNNFNKGTS